VPEVIQRSVLTIPDRNDIGLTTYDAKDPMPRETTSSGWSSLVRRWLRQRRNRNPLPRWQRICVGRVDATVPLIFSVDKTADVGQGTGATVSDRYKPRGQSVSPARSSGCRSRSTLLPPTRTTSPEKRLHLAMARQ
jgi:hypothetical protein